MKNQKVKTILENIIDQTFPSIQKDNFHDFKFDALKDNVSFLMVWPAIMIIKLCELTNDQRLAEELKLLKNLELIYLIDPTLLGNRHNPLLQQDYTLDSMTPTRSFNQEMFFIIKIIHYKKKYLWKILITLHDQNKSFQLFDDLIRQYYLFLFVLLQHNQTKKNKILLFHDDMVEYLFQANSERPALYHLSCLSLYYLLDLDMEFNSYKIQKSKGPDDKEWTIDRQYDSNCLEALRKKEGDINFDENRYCFDGSALKTSDFKRILSVLLFQTADKLLFLKQELTYMIKNLPKELPRLYAQNPQNYTKLFSEIKKSEEFSSIFYHNKILLKHAQTITSELNTKFNKNFLLKDHIQELNKIVELQSKKIELYPEVEEVLIKAIDELWKLHNFFDGKKKQDKKYQHLSYSPERCLDYFNEYLNKNDYPILKKIDPVLIFFKDPEKYYKQKKEEERKRKQDRDKTNQGRRAERKKESIINHCKKENVMDEKYENENQLLAENWERNLGRRILPILKLDSEGTPWGRPVNGSDLWKIVKTMYKDRNNNP